MTVWMFLVALVLLGKCVKIVDGHNCCHPETKKFLVPGGFKGVQPTRLHGAAPDSGAAGCSPETCGKAEPEPPPPPPPDTCPGPSVCEGAETCGAMQGSDPADSKPNRPGLVDFETLLKDYAFYDEVDKRILTYHGDKKMVRFAPGTKKDPSEPIYTHELKSVIDYEHRDDDCSESFWGCLVGDLVADVLSESSNDTKELVEDVIQTLEAVHDIGHAVLDHLEGHPNKQESEATEEESFDARRKKKKTNYPFLPPATEETCPGCVTTDKSSETQSEGLDALIQEEGGECQTVQEADTEPEPVAAAGGDEGDCNCDAFVSKSCSLPAERCLVSAERKSKDNYPFLEEKSQPSPVLNRGSCKSGLHKAKEVISKHAEGVMSKMMDSPPFDKIQKAIFEKADGAVSSVLSNLTKTAQMTEKVTKIVFDRANETMSKVFAVQINETGIPRQWVCEHRVLAETFSLGEGASNERHLEILHCLPEYLKYSFEGATGDEKPRELISESKQINELLHWKMQDVEPNFDVYPSQVKTSQPKENFQNLKISEDSPQCNDTGNKCVIANCPLWGTHREEISRPELNISAYVNATKESLAQEESDSLLPNRHIKFDIEIEQSAIAGEGDPESSSKLAASTIPSLQNIPNETDVTSKSTGKDGRKRKNRRFLTVEGDISNHNLISKSEDGKNKKKTKWTAIGLDRYGIERKKRRTNKRRFATSKILDVAKQAEDESHEINSGRRRTFDWKYMKF